MDHIRPVDLAWQAVNAVHVLSAKVLASIEAMGENRAAAANSRDFSEAAKTALAQVLAHIEAPNGLKIPDLIAGYKASERYKKLTHESRVNYDTMLNRMDRDIGDVAVASTTLDFFKSCHECGNVSAAFSTSLVDCHRAC